RRANKRPSRRPAGPPPTMHTLVCLLIIFFSFHECTRSIFHRLFRLGEVHKTVALPVFTSDWVSAPRSHESDRVGNDMVSSHRVQRLAVDTLASSASGAGPPRVGPTWLPSLQRSDLASARANEVANEEYYHHQVDHDAETCLMAEEL